MLIRSSLAINVTILNWNVKSLLVPAPKRMADGGRVLKYVGKHRRRFALKKKSAESKGGLNTLKQAVIKNYVTP